MEKTYKKNVKRFYGLPSNTTEASKSVVGGADADMTKNIKRFWGFFRENGNIISDLTDITNGFNNFFSPLVVSLTLT